MLLLLLLCGQEDGFVEYHNAVVVQPHKKLVTNQGRFYQVRCRYPTRETNSATISGINVRSVQQNHRVPALLFIDPLAGVHRGSTAESRRDLGRSSF